MEPELNLLDVDGIRWSLRYAGFDRRGRVVYRCTAPGDERIVRFSPVTSQGRRRRALRHWAGIAVDGPIDSAALWQLRVAGAHLDDETADV